MTLTKAQERTILEQVAALLTPHLAHADTYGVHAARDFCVAWANALDSDVPIDCFTRDADAQRRVVAAAQERADKVVDAAKQQAARIVREAENSAALIRDRMRRAIMETERAFGI